MRNIQLLKNESSFYFILCFTGFFAIILFGLSLLLGDINIIHMSQFNKPIFFDIIKEYRLPSALVGIFAAINFSLSGILLQTITKNNLTTPNIIGMNTGASLFAIISLLYLSKSSVVSTNLFAFFGSIFACFLYIILAKNDFKNKMNIMNGIALDSIFVSLTAIILLIFPNETGSISLWLAGSLWGKKYSDLTLLFPSCILGIVFCIIYAQKLNILSMNEDYGKSLGLNINLNKMIFLIIACLLSGTAAACTGPIGFISLFVPNVAKIILGDNLRKVIPFSITLSVIIITISDILSRVLIAPNQIPIGIVVSALCSPYLIVLVKYK